MENMRPKDIIMAEDQNRTLQDKFMLRLPEGMRQEIKSAADSNKRSMNAEIIARLEASLATNSMTADSFVRIMDAQYVNAGKIAEILRDALQRLEDLSVGAVRIEDVGDADSPAGGGGSADAGSRSKFTTYHSGPNFKDKM